MTSEHEQQSLEKVRLGGLLIPPPDRGESAPIRDFLYVMFRHKFKAAAFMFGVVAVAVMMIKTEDELFVSDANLLVRRGRENLLLDPIASSGRMVPMHSEFRADVNSELEILRSRELVEAVVDNLGPRYVLGQVAPPEKKEGDESGKGVGGLKKWVKSLRTGQPEPPTPEELAQALKDRAMLHLGRSRSIRVIPDSNIIAISVTAENPQIAQKTLYVLIEEFKEKHLAVYRTEGAYGFFENRLDEVRKELEGIDSQLLAIQSQPGASAILADRDSALTLGANLQIQYESVTADRAAAEKRVAALQEAFKVREAEDTAGMQVVDYNDFKRIRSSVLDESSKLVSLTAKEDFLAQRIKDFQKEMKVANSAAHDMYKLERRRALLEENLRDYTGNLEQAHIDNALDEQKMSNIREIQAPTMPLEAEPTHKMPKLLLALMVGLVGGVGVAFSVEYLDHTVTRPQSLTPWDDLPVLESIPRAVKAFRRANRPRSAAGLLTRKASAEPTRWQIPKAARYAYESLANRVVMGNARTHQQQPAFLGVTSCDQGEGVSTVAASLAVAIAQIEPQARVLVVDANSANTSNHRLLDTTKGPGMAAVTVQENGVTAVLEQVLYLSEKREHQTGDVFQSDGVWQWEKFSANLHHLPYDYVVFDLPPVNRSVLPVRLSNIMDNLLFVVECERTDTTRIRAAHEQLTNAGGHVAGVVLNKRRYYIPAWLYKHV